MPESLPALDSCGFVQVPGEPTLWMKCDKCQKSDHFWMEGDVRCRCGARYDHAVRPDGARIPVAQLRFVPFEQGPAALKDLEWDPRRIGVLVAVLVVLIGLAVFFLR